MGFLTDETLAREAAQYGNAGARPQVIWPNGVLASTAVGLAVELVTNWTRSHRLYAWLLYNGNDNTMTDSLTLRNRQTTTCPHFSEGDIGDPVFTEF
jgi:hypothetical protein